MEAIFVTVTTITGLGAYLIGKFVGINQTFEQLKREGKIIDRDELRKLGVR